MSHKRSYKAFKRKALMLIGDTCVDCGSKERIEIDHVDWRLKSFNVSDEYSSKNWRDMVEELRKCVPRCHDCHVIKTRQDVKEMAKERPESERDYKHKTRYAYKRMGCRCEECIEWGRADAAKRREARQTKP